jgi:N-acetylglutamate synthase-like GNAT family acetyltransferase
VQIRIANRQDEPEIRTFVDTVYQKSGSSLNIESQDSDLRNIEANYFGKEGLFLVAEDEGTIVGIAGARKKTETVLELKRLLVPVSDQFENKEVLDELLRVIVEFAPRMLYENIDSGLGSNECETVLKERGFRAASGQSSLSLAVTPSF